MHRKPPPWSFVRVLQPIPHACRVPGNETGSSRIGCRLSCKHFRELNTSTPRHPFVTSPSLAQRNGRGLQSSSRCCPLNGH